MYVKNVFNKGGGGGGECWKRERCDVSDVKINKTLQILIRFI